jgi:hypothetical protein
MLHEQAHYHDGGANFPQSTFQVAFFIPHPAYVSKLPDKNLHSLFDIQEQIHNAQCLDDDNDDGDDDKNQAALLSLMRAHLFCFFGARRRKTLPV